MATPRTTTNTTAAPRLAEPKATAPKKQSAKKPASKKPASKKPATSRTTTATTQPGLTGDPVIDAMLDKIRNGGSGSAADLDDLYSDAEATVRNYDIYVGTDNGFTSKRGTPRTKIKASELFDSLASMSDARYRQLQEQLFAGGFFGTANRKAVAFGARNDTDTRDALARAVARNVVANRTTTRTSRLTLADILDDAQRNAPAAISEGDGSNRAPFAFQPMDPQAIRYALDEIVPTIIGHGLAPDEQERFVVEFQTKLEQAARSAYIAEGSGGVAMPKPDFESFVRSRAEELHPVEAGARRLADLSEQFLQAIQSTPGQVDRVF